jgi:hypothetical protein
MISLSNLQTKYASIVDDRDKLYAELNELRSRSNLLGTCGSCQLLKVDVDSALCRVKNFEEHTCPDLPDCSICPTLRSELNVAKSHIVELEKHTCPVLPSCLTCPNFVVENNDLRTKLADLEEENKHLRTILGWCSIREPQIGMAIAQIKRGERFGPGYDLKHVFGEKSGPPVDEKNPPLAKYTGPPPRKGSGVTSDGLLVETSRSAPKKQVWVPKPKHFKGVQNTKPNGSSCDHFAKPVFVASSSNAEASFAPARKLYHCDFCSHDGHLYEFCYRRMRAERREQYPTRGTHDRRVFRCEQYPVRGTHDRLVLRREPFVRSSGFRSRTRALAQHRDDRPRFPPRGSHRFFENF